MSSKSERGILMRLAAEGMIPVVGGCAGALAGGAEVGMAGIAVGHVVEKAINFFGARIVERWQMWFRGRPVEERVAALAELAALSPEQARDEAASVLAELAPHADSADRSLALEYLAAIPRTLDRAMIRDSVAGVASLPPTVSLDEPAALLQLLPIDVPPYGVPSDLPNTPYRLRELLGAGGFGAVYKATATTLQHLPLAIKFCLDRSLHASLQQERANLERLMQAGGEGWAKRIVRLYGYDLDHRTPYLVYEFVPGGDLLHHLGKLVKARGRTLTADEVFEIVRQIADALAFAHKLGLVHRDLKPANVLVDGDVLKLADFGLGSVMVARANQVSRAGTTTLSLMTAADQVSLFRGAGTPLYMSPEQRRGANPDPRHDLYSLGVMWFQLLVGDTTRELHVGWAKELALRFRVPRGHSDLIERCVGWFDERPKDASELLALMANPAAPVPTVEAVAVVAPPTEAGEEIRQTALASMLRQIEDGQRQADVLTDKPLWLYAVLVLVATAFGVASGMLTGDLAYKYIYPYEYQEYSATYLKRDFQILVVLTGLGIGSLVGVNVFLLQLRFLNRRAAAVRERVAAKVAEVQREFPRAIETWGGPVVLRDAASVSSLRRRLVPQSEPRRVSVSDLVRPTEEKYQHVLLGVLLRQVMRTHSALNQLRGIPLVFAYLFPLFFIALPISTGIGVGFGFLTHEAIYTDYRNRHFSDLMAGLVGVPVGLAVFVGFVLLLRTWVRRRQVALAQRLDDQIQEVTRTYGDEVAKWGGAAVMRNYDAIAQVFLSLTPRA